MAALRAGSLAFILSVLGTVAIAAAVLSGPPGPKTIAEAIGAPSGPVLDERRALAVAERTRACMAALGLPYDAIPDRPPDIPDADLDPVAWAERWGFGIATSMGTEPPGSPRDPNAVRLGEMTGAARSLYVTALYGDGADRRGCHGSAIDAVHGLRDRALAPLRSRLADLQRSIDADPGIRAAEEGWAQCLRDLGIRATDRTTLLGRMRRSFTERAAAVAGDARLIAAVAAEERRIASGIARCEATYADAMADIAAPYEAAFVTTYRSVLRRIGQRIREAEAAYPISQARGRGAPRGGAAR